MIRRLSRSGILLGTVDTAQQPALLDATSPLARGATLYGPSGPGQLGGGPAEQRLFRPLRDPVEADRVWRVSEALAGVSFPTAAAA